MKKCKRLNKSKHLAYGQTYDHKGCKFDICDCYFSPTINKKSERQKAKRNIRKELNDDIRRLLYKD